MLLKEGEVKKGKEKRHKEKEDRESRDDDDDISPKRRPIWPLPQCVRASSVCVDVSVVIFFFHEWVKYCRRRKGVHDHVCVRVLCFVMRNTIASSSSHTTCSLQTIKYNNNNAWWWWWGDVSVSVALLPSLSLSHAHTHILDTRTNGYSRMEAAEEAPLFGAGEDGSGRRQVIECVCVFFSTTPPAMSDTCCM